MMTDVQVLFKMDLDTDMPFTSVRVSFLTVGAICM